MCFYLGHVFSELKSCIRLVKVLRDKIMRKNLNAESSSLFTVVHY